VELSEHAARNRRFWEAESARYEEPGRHAWASDEPSWGIWRVPERELRALPEVAGKDVVELGCGTAYWSAWLARMGARPVGVDVTDGQLGKARRFQQEFRIDFPLVQASAEAVPLPDASFDVALSEYGACLWCDPDRWVAEAARLLRPGGELVFLTNGLFLELCTSLDGERPAGAELVRDQFGLYRVEFPELDEGVEFHLPHGEWIRTLRRHGFDVVDLIEVQAPEGATTRFSFVTPEWARRWPSEEIWRARKTG